MPRATTNTSVLLQATGCSSLWDEFRTLTNPLARLQCCHRQFCVSAIIWSDFKGHHSKCSCGEHASLYLSADPFAYFSGGPSLA
eukprot:6173866-Pleurochrysis_carterae.AAC.2